MHRNRPYEDRGAQKYFWIWPLGYRFHLFPAHRCSSVIKFQIRLECASVNRSNVLLISKAYFSANQMN